MARVRALIGALIALVALATIARAQSLQRLTITSLTLATDTRTPRLEVPFHLVVTAHTRERVTTLDDVVLPILAELELLGDEHALTSDASGSTYRETVTVVAHHTGPVTIAPVTIDAVDARDGKRKRFFSNPLALDVAGGTLEPAPVTMSLMRTLGVTGLALAVGAAVLLLGRRVPRRVAPTPAPVAAPPPFVPPPDPIAALRDAHTTLNAERTRAAAMNVRVLVRRMVGATERETLADALLRPGAQSPAIATLLRALERAAFTHDADLASAIDGALDALHRMIA